MSDTTAVDREAAQKWLAVVMPRMAHGTATVEQGCLQTYLAGLAAGRAQATEQAAKAARTAFVIAQNGHCSYEWESLKQSRRDEWIAAVEAALRVVESYNGRPFVVLSFDEVIPPDIGMGFDDVLPDHHTGR